MLERFSTRKKLENINDLRVSSFSEFLVPKIHTRRRRGGGRGGEKMLRRKPTRLELKMDDTEEFESVKKELESRKRRREEAESAAASATLGGGASATGGGDTRSRAELVHERIGYKPHPQPATLPALFGNLQF
ncbi:anaphase-promoting complex subunit CDC26 [Polymixia lowei]